jgi:DNA polymerase (family X)
MDNAEITRVLDEVADLLEILGENPFRIRAYRTAARTIETLTEAAERIVLRDPKALATLPGIAKDLAGKIAEIVTTGDLELHRELIAKVPASLTTMMHIAAIGPKRAKLFYDTLHIRSLEDLETAARGGKLHGIRGVGETLEKRIVEGCAAQHTQAGRRISLSEADAHATRLVAYLRASPAAAQVDVAGSLRRRRETIGDVDLLVASRDPVAVADRFISYPELVKVLAHGKTKCAGVLRSGVQVDVRIIEPSCWGAALHYFTGSKAHNIAIRTLGVKRKLKINEYGVFRGERRISGGTEEEIFAAVGLPWIPPELREDRGEIDQAREGHLPDLVELSDIRGDLHVHTDAGGGESTLREMVEACLARGYEYVCIADHTKVAAAHVAGGLDRAGLRRQRRAIETLRRHIPGITILHGAEVDILEDGELALDDETLGELDLVLAAVHSKLDMPEPRMTARVLAALANPHVDVLAHPTGRLIGQREASPLDVGKVVAMARDRGVLLEINAQPDRLDLCDAFVRMARDAGVRLVVDTGAHSVAELDFMRYGVDQARRGWCTKSDVANTLPLATFRARLRRTQSTTTARRVRSRARPAASAGTRASR